MSKVATEKLPSLIQVSPAWACFIRVRKLATSSSVHCGCQIASSEITGAPVRSPNCRAKVVLPLPAHPRMTTRDIVAIMGRGALSRGILRFAQDDVRRRRDADQN